MGLETGSFISDLVAANPGGGDDRSTADDHIRLLKTVLKAQFPNLNAAVNTDPTVLNLLEGLTTNAVTLNQLDGATITAAKLTALNAMTSAEITALATISEAQFIVLATITEAQFTALQALSATELGYLDGVTSNIQTQIDNIQFPGGALVYKSANQVISGSDVALLFDSESYDTDTIHDTVTNSERLTVPTGVSKVRLSFRVPIIPDSASGAYTVTLTKNNLITYAGVVILQDEFSSISQFQAVATSPILNVSPGDYFSLKISESVAIGTATVVGGASGAWFAMEIIE